VNVDSGLRRANIIFANPAILLTGGTSSTRRIAMPRQGGPATDHRGRCSLFFPRDKKIFFAFSEGSILERCRETDDVWNAMCEWHAIGGFQIQRVRPKSLACVPTSNPGRQHVNTIVANIELKTYQIRMSLLNRDAIPNSGAAYLKVACQQNRCN
jgi:hypothetical protein